MFKSGKKFESCRFFKIKFSFVNWLQLLFLESTYMQINCKRYQTEILVLHTITKKLY